MNPVVIPVRNAVTSFLSLALSSGTLTPNSMVPVPAYDISFRPSDLETSDRMLVVPEKKDPTLLARGGAQIGEIGIDVSVQHLCSSTGPTPTELDPYLNMIDVLAETMLGRQLVLTFPSGSAGLATCLKAEHPHLWYPEHLRAMPQIFTSVCRVTFSITQP